MLLEEIKTKVEVAQENSAIAKEKSEIAASESLRTNQTLAHTALSTRTNRQLQWVATVVAVISFVIYMETIRDANKSEADAAAATLIQHTSTLKTYGDRLNGLDTKVGQIQSDTSYVRGVIQGWQQGPLQPVKH